ncbi:MAG: chemotaxis protein CheD [Candidatus Nitrosocaldaceae archaeon]
MKNVRNIVMGEYIVTDNEYDAITTFVGSCIALYIYDQKRRITGAAHIALPTCKNGNKSEKGKYADLAIESILEIMEKKGSNIKELNIKLAGGAQIFTSSSSELFNIGRNNINAVKNILNDKGIRIVAEDLGGNYGRHITFNLNTFELIIKSTKGVMKTI